MAGFTSQPVRVGYAALVVILLGLLYQLPGLAPWLLAVAVLWWMAATYLVLTKAAACGVGRAVVC